MHAGQSYDRLSHVIFVLGQQTETNSCYLQTLITEVTSLYVATSLFFLYRYFIFFHFGILYAIEDEMISGT